jgi:hypothetical protein
MRIKTATGVLTLAIVLTFCLRGGTAPAPSEELTAKARLLALEKKLPEFFTETVDKTWLPSRYEASVQYKTSVRYVRMTGPTSARIAVRLEGFVNNISKSNLDDVLVIHLSYYDGVWTTQQYEGTITDDRYNNRRAKFLLVALDELAAK